MATNNTPSNANVKSQVAGGVLGGAHMGGHSDVAKPNPTPTSVSQLKDTVSTMMNKGSAATGSKQDPNTYSGTYGGSNWSFSKGKATRVK